MSQFAEVTSFERLKEYSNGEIVRLPDFAEGQEFIARLRRPSMLALAKTGKIPNELLSEAQKLFSSGATALSDTSGKRNNMLGDMYDICISIVKEALVEPTYDDVQRAGLELTDEQILAIFSYTQNGIESLKQFRENGENS